MKFLFIRKDLGFVLISTFNLLVGLNAYGDFKLYKKGGGFSSYEVILLGHDHADQSRPDYVGNFQASERFILSEGGIVPGKTAILLEGVAPGGRPARGEAPLPGISPNVTISGWDNKALNFLSYSILDGVRGFSFPGQEGPELLGALIMRYSLELAFDIVSVVYRNRNLAESVRIYGEAGFKRIYVLAGTNHFVDPELISYLSEAKIRHQVWLAKEYVSTHGGVIGVDPHSEELEAEKRVYFDSVERMGVNLDQFRALAQAGAERILQGALKDGTIKVLPPLSGQHVALSFGSFMCHKFL